METATIMITSLKLVEGGEMVAIILCDYTGLMSSAEQSTASTPDIVRGNRRSRGLDCI